jgi:hypothetical protein
MTFCTRPATGHAWHPAAASLPQAKWHIQTHDLPPHPKRSRSRAGHTSGHATQDGNDDGASNPDDAQATAPTPGDAEVQRTPGVDLMLNHAQAVQAG